MKTLLIPFKARAFLDLKARSDAGEKVDGNNIKKHRNDGFRLVQLPPAGASVEKSSRIRTDLGRFVELAQADETLDPKALGVPFTRDEALALFGSVYGLT